jgi:glycosyltransferase involved in cell wall biosynthesis
MRVLHVVTAFPRFEGDVITPWLIETLKQLRAKGIDVEVFTSSYQGLGDQQLFGLPVHRFRYFPKRWENLTHDETTPDRMRKGLLYKFMAVAYVLCGYLAIARLCRKQKYDIVHIHWPFPHAAFGPGVRPSGCKVIASFYGVELRWVKSRLPVFKSFLRWAIRSADAITAISTYTANEIRDLEPCAVTIIPFGAALQEPQAASRKPQAGVPGLPATILFVGRLVERKGVRYLIDAIKLVRAKLDVRLVIVGDGSERPNLEAQAKALGLQDVVTFRGFISVPERNRCYQDCDVFALPAITDSKGDTEGLGVVLLEAMMHRRPVIASSAGGITDIVKHEQTGLLVPEKDSRALADAVIRVLTDRALAQRLGEQGYGYARDNFGWDRIVTLLTGLYSRLVGENRDTTGFRGENGSVPIFY